MVIFQADAESPSVMHKCFVKNIDVVEDGIVWTDAIEKLMKYASLFTGKIEVSFGNSVTVKKEKHRKRFRNVVIDECVSAIRCKQIFENLVVEGDSVKDKQGNEWDMVIRTTGKEVQKIVEDTTLIGGTMFPISVKPNDDGEMELVVEVHTSTEDSMRVLDAELEGFEEAFSEDYAYGFDPVFKNIDGKIEIRVSKTNPLMIVKSSEKDIFHRFVIAPRREEKDDFAEEDFDFDEEELTSGQEEDIEEENEFAEFEELQEDDEEEE